MKNSILPKNITKEQSKDSGMVLILLLLVLSRYFNQKYFFIASIIILIINMIFPDFFKPFAFVWFSLSNILGLIIPKILLTIIYYIFIVPLGLIFKFIGKDLLIINKFKKDKNSVFKDRNHTYNSNDIENPY